jgi:hypothetical protein
MQEARLLRHPQRRFGKIVVFSRYQMDVGLHWVGLARL